MTSTALPLALVSLNTVGIKHRVHCRFLPRSKLPHYDLIISMNGCAFGFVSNLAGWSSAASKQRECTREIGARIIEWARALNADTDADNGDDNHAEDCSQAGDFGEFSAAAAATATSATSATALQPPATPLGPHGNGASSSSYSSYSNRLTASAILSPSTVVAAAARDALGATPVAQPRFSIDGDEEE